MSTFSSFERRPRAFALRSLLTVAALAILFVLVSLYSPSALAQTTPPQHAALVAPKALGLSRFSAKAKKKTVQLTWQTDSEITIVGFHIWRRAEGAQYKRIDATLIEAQHIGEIAGGTYADLDKTVKKGKVYYYQLEVVGVNGDSNWTEEHKVKIKQ